MRKRKLKQKTSTLSFRVDDPYGELFKRIVGGMNISIGQVLEPHVKEFVESNKTVLNPRIVADVEAKAN